MRRARRTLVVLVAVLSCAVAAVQLATPRGAPVEVMKCNHGDSACCFANFLHCYDACNGNGYCGSDCWRTYLSCAGEE